VYLSPPQSFHVSASFGSVHLQQSISGLTAGVNYVLTVQAMGASVNLFDFSLGCENADASGAGTDIITPVGSWTQYSITCTFNSGAGYVIFDIGGLSGYVWFDDVQFYRSP
jgi:hypothetical protein